MTPKISKVARSRFKKKLIVNDILIEYGSKKRLMLNPFIFLPTGDKNIENSQYMDQLAWKYLTIDKDIYSSDIEEYVHWLFEQ